MKLVHVILLILMTAMVFGGSFTCSYNDDDDHPTTQN